MQTFNIRFSFSTSPDLHGGYDRRPDLDWGFDREPDLQLYWDSDPVSSKQTQTITTFFRDITRGFEFTGIRTQKIYPDPYEQPTGGAPGV